MTATNHALTGAAIGLLVGEPLIAVPAAIASHFICDALPHYGRVGPDSRRLAARVFATICCLMLLCVLCS